MINQQYALKYSFPHSVVHILDNSARTVDTGVTEANDPSLLSTLVVTGAPMGQANKVLPLTRSDVAGVAFGLNNLTPSDVKKYGQGVTYAMDLINQQVPVQFMRVVPSNSIYAMTALVIQWKMDATDNSLHVRFKIKNWEDSGLPQENFKNTDRINEALVKAFKQDSVDEGWIQRAFVNYIAAGPGRTYNDFAMIINPVSQAKRPTNAKYQFLTVDKKTSATIEAFTASLINTNVGTITASTTTDSVNTQVASRVAGSSIVVPYVNESAIEEIYKQWTDFYQERIDNGDATDEQVAMFNSMNINIFDVIFGKYIFNGSSTDVTLPFYTVDMETSELPKLNPQNILSTRSADFDENKPEVLYNRLVNQTIGVTDPDSEAFVGDIIVTPSSSGAITSPKVSIITAVNQYTGLVTSMAMPAIFTLIKSGNDYVFPSSPVAGQSKRPKIITWRATGTGTGTKSEDVRSGILNNSINPEDIIITANRDDLTKFGVFMVMFDSTANRSDAAANYVLYPYDPKDYYAMFDRDAHSGKKEGTGNAFGFVDDETDSKCANRIGSGVVVIADGAAATDLPEVYVNTYNRTAADAAETDGEYKNRVKVNRTTGMKVGPVPTEITHENISGTNFDVEVFEDANIQTWRVDTVNGLRIDPEHAGAKYEVGDRLYVCVNINTIYTLTMSQPADWSTKYYTDYYTRTGTAPDYTYALVPQAAEAPAWAPDTYYAVAPNDTNTVIHVTAVGPNGEIRGIAYESTLPYENIAASVPISTVKDTAKETVFVDGDFDPTTRTGFSAAKFYVNEYDVIEGTPSQIVRYVVSGSYNSLYASLNTHSRVPKNYYSSDQGDNPSSTNGMSLAGGYAGFFDELSSDSIEYKWRYSALLVEALRGSENFDRRILSPHRVPAKFMFDGGYNTLVGSVLTGNIASYRPADIINASIIFTDEEKSEVILYPETIDNIGVSVDIDVKQAMYDLMIQRVYDGIPEDKRPIGPGSGFQVFFDSGVTDADTTTLVRESFLKRFSNPNASWDIGGFTERSTGLSYTFTKHIVEDMFRHINVAGINKPYAGKTTAIQKDRYIDFFPDLDITDWGKREDLYLSGGNAWIMGRDGSLERKTQVTLYRDAAASSDLLQENNMRTLSRLIYLLQEKIDSYLLEYNSDSVLKTLSDEVNNMFSNWIGNYVDGLDIQFVRDTNVDGADILVCYVEVVFRGLILRVPIIVNVAARQ